MAGAGFKTFNTGDVLTASDVNTYLMQQTVMVFADASARSTALGANVAEGMISYLKDTNAVEVYNGSAWVSSDDPNAIQNTIVDAKGDIITATAADTPARLAVGSTNGQTLMVDSTAATGLKWGDTQGTLIGTYTMSGTATTRSVDNVFTSAYDNYLIIGYLYLSTSSASAYMKLRLSGTDSSASYYSLYNYTQINGANVGTTKASNSTAGIILNNVATEDFNFALNVFNPALARLTGFASIGSQKFGTDFYAASNSGVHDVATAYDGLTITSSQNLNGAFSIYGLRK